MAHHYWVDDKGKRGEARQAAHTSSLFSTVSLQDVKGQPAFVSRQELTMANQAAGAAGNGDCQ